MTTETKTTPIPKTTTAPEEGASAVLSLQEEYTGASESLYTLALPPP